MTRSVSGAFRPLRRPPGAPPIRSAASRARCAVAAAMALVAPMSAGAAKAAEPGSAAAPGLADILAHTPFWVWVVLALLIWLGIKRLQPREVTMGRLLVMPIIVGVLAVSNVSDHAGSLAVLAGTAIGGLLGVAAGMAREKARPAVLQRDGRLLLPGEWLSLVTVLAVFLVHYVTTVVAAIDPDLAQTDRFVLTGTILSAFFSVMMITRAALRVRLATTPAAA